MDWVFNIPLVISHKCQYNWDLKTHFITQPYKINWIHSWTNIYDLRKESKWVTYKNFLYKPVHTLKQKSIMFSLLISFYSLSSRCLTIFSNGFMIWWVFKIKCLKSSRLIHVFLKIFWRFAVTKRASSELLKILTSQ